MQRSRRRARASLVAQDLGIVARKGKLPSTRAHARTTVKQQAEGKRKKNDSQRSDGCMESIRTAVKGSDKEERKEDVQ